MERLKELWDKLGEQLFIKLQDQKEQIEFLSNEVCMLRDEQEKQKDKNNKLARILHDAASAIEDNQSW